MFAFPSTRPHRTAAVLLVSLAAVACGSGTAASVGRVADEAAETKSVVVLDTGLPRKAETSELSTPAVSSTSAPTPAAAPTTTAPSTTVPPTTSTTAVPTTTVPEPVVTLAASPPPTGICEAVVHVGDSTSVGMIDPDFQPDGGLRIDAQYARVGIPLEAQILEIEGARSIVEGPREQVNARDVAQNARNGGFTGCWVVAMGTTDTANVSAGSNILRQERIDRMMEVIGDEPALWINAHTLVTRGHWSADKMTLWNDELAAAADRYPNIRILDWASIAVDDWFLPDAIHYTSVGYAERARIIADALSTAFPASAPTASAITTTE